MLVMECYAMKERRPRGAAREKYPRPDEGGAEARLVTYRAALKFLCQDLVAL